ncbi:hypothetical protein Q8A73_001306 [Channa argus]|nr:hypothetical protein Q8A73_001306 [Channa argus]
MAAPAQGLRKEAGEEGRRVAGGLRYEGRGEENDRTENGRWWKGVACWVALMMSEGYRKRKQKAHGGERKQSCSHTTGDEEWRSPTVPRWQDAGLERALLAVRGAACPLKGICSTCQGLQEPSLDHLLWVEWDLGGPFISTEQLSRAPPPPPAVSLFAFCVEECKADHTLMESDGGLTGKPA